MAGIAAPFLPLDAKALETDVWPADRAQAALAVGQISMIDVRSRQEWAETGVAAGAWPISLHEARFEPRLLAARDLAGRQPVALICATGGRSGRLLSALKRAGYSEFIDVSEGMLGSRAGPGWIARGLPILDHSQALAALPSELA